MQPTRRIAFLPPLSYGDPPKMITFPKSLAKWIASLPPEDRERETRIAERNLKRIASHLRRPISE